MAAVTGGQLVARFLKNEGVDTIFTLCGGHVMDIYNGCVDENIRVIDVRHEQSAAHAADGWSRITGKPGVAVVTAGPGVTDSVTGVANAFRAQVPMLVIGGQAPVRNLLKGSLQELNHVELMKPITKFAATAYHTDRIPELMGMAIREAYNGRPGPSFLEIPNDVLDGKVDDTEVKFPVHYRSKGRTTADKNLIDQAARVLARAERPALIAGSQVWNCRAAGLLDAFVRKAKIPVYLNGAARGCLAEDLEFVLSRSRTYALSKADAVAVIGTPFDFRLGYGGRLAQGAKIIQVDLDYAELCHNRDVEVALNGDVGAVLEQLTAAIAALPGNKAWLSELQARESELSQGDREFMNSDSVPIHPLRLAREINDFLTDDTIFIADGGDVVTISASLIRTHKPGHWLDPGPLGTLGVGAPFAIAAKAAEPQKDVFVLFGDGAFGLTGFDFDTLVRFNMPVIGVVANNAAWNQVRYVQLQKYGPERGDVANELSHLRYDKIIEAMGGYGENVTEPSQIRPALERAKNSGKPALLNVIVDRDVFSSSTRNMGIYK